VRGRAAAAASPLGRIGLRPGRIPGSILRMRDIGESSDAAAFMLAPVEGDEMVGMVSDNGEVQRRAPSPAAGSTRRRGSRRAAQAHAARSARGIGVFQGDRGDGSR
jgi:hypothetical protein